MFLLLLEFQSADDRWMALRILTYSGLLCQELIRSRAPEVARERLPAGETVPLVRTLEESMTLVERAAEWPKQWLREGREQGLVEGRAQGVDQQRALLCRQAAARFDADTAARLADLLAPMADPERLAEIGDWLVRCDTAAEFLARFDPAARS